MNNTEKRIADLLHENKRLLQENKKLRERNSLLQRNLDECSLLMLEAARSLEAPTLIRQDPAKTWETRLREFQNKKP